MKVLVCLHEFDNGTPARVDRERGVIELAPSFFKKTEDEQSFILLHEVGHYLKRTKNEDEADRYAAESLSQRIGFRRTADAANRSMHDTPQNDKRREKIFNFLADKDRKNGNNIMDLNIKDMVCTDDGRMVEVKDGFTNEDGFTYINNIISEGEISDLELTDYMNFCKFYGLPLCADAVIVFRESKQEDLSNFSLKSQKRRDAEAEETRLRQQLERGLISQETYDNLMAGIDTRSGVEKFWDKTTTGVTNAVKNLLGNSGEVVQTSSSKGSSMLPVAIILIAVAIGVVYFAMKKQ